MIAQFQEQDRKRQQVVEEKCAPPSPRFVNSCHDCSNYVELDFCLCPNKVTQHLETTLFSLLEQH